GSYSEVLQSINAGILPPKDTVRIEQMINYFNYDYPGPRADELFSVNVDVASCPWEQSHRLVRIGLKGREAPRDVHGANVIARDTKIDVEFNPMRVGSYRLIGYDRRSLQGENSNREGARDHGIAAGYTVTALYELVPVAQQFITRQEAQTLLSAKLRFKKPDGNGEVQSIERSVTDDWVDFAQAHPDLKFAAAVAEFGMILCDSGYKGSGTLGAVLKWAQDGKGADANGYRAGFIELVRKAQTLKKS
ncbi:MAG: von Willebrand factor type A domain-containing protein, partial [Candidatus Udaeobacter sp.]